MSWDEEFADRYEEWSGRRTADIEFYAGLARAADGPLAQLPAFPSLLPCPWRRWVSPLPW